MNVNPHKCKKKQAVFPQEIIGSKIKEVFKANKKSNDSRPKEEPISKRNSRSRKRQVSSKGCKAP